MKSILALALLALPVFAQANTLSEDLIGNLYTMKTVYSAEYAPAAWKKKFANYDLETSFRTAIAAAQANPNMTLKESREILKNFIYAMKDYHTSISFVSTEVATLPFMVKSTGTHAYIMYVDRAKMPEFPFNIGDELVTFGGVSAMDAIAAVQAEIPGNVPGTDKALAELSLTRRRAARGLNVPQGPIMIGVKAQGSDAVSQYELIWDYTPERIKPRSVLTSSTDFAAETKKSSAFRPKMSVDFADKSTASPYDLGGKKSFVPSLGLKIWTSSDADTFDAYIYKNEAGKLIGYIRIPQYEVDGDDYVKAVAEFGRDIALMESTTESLVIDQNNNPGGSVFYLYALASMLATQPLKTPLHRMSITQADVMDALNQISQLSTIKNDADAQKAISLTDTNGYPVTYEFAQFQLNYARFLVSEWNAGRKLTNPYWIAGVNSINPNPVHYTKPILFLTNHLDFSGGDFMPATLQDNKRVTILGSRTAGAGGYVNDITIQNNIGVNAFRCTESIAERLDKNPIENLGITPELEHEMTDADFANNYVDYVAAIKAAVATMTTK